MTTSEESRVMTVLGPVSAHELGPTYMHEHVIVNNKFSGNNPDKSLSEEDVAIWEMKDVLRAGGRTMVEVTCSGLGPDPAALKRIADASGIHIVASVGFYRYIVYPDYVSACSIDQLASRMIGECEDGIDGTDVRPGMLGEFASHDSKAPGSPGHLDFEPPNEDVEKVFRAAGRTHCATGLPVTTHCPRGVGAEWEIEVLKEEGVGVAKIIIGHMGMGPPDLDHARWILDQGVYVAIDSIGYGERDLVDFFEHGQAQLIKTFVEWGHVDQIVVSMDMTRRYHLKKYGGHGYAYLMDCFAPLLREVGLSDEQVDRILIDNPRRVLGQ